MRSSLQIWQLFRYLQSDLKEKNFFLLLKFYLEHIVLDIGFALLNLGNLFPDGNESVAEPVQLSLRAKGEFQLNGITTKNERKSFVFFVFCSLFVETYFAFALSRFNHECARNRP